MPPPASLPPPSEARTVRAVTTKQEVVEACRAGGLVVLKFGAAWCGPCRVMEPIAARWLREEAPPEVTLLAADADEAGPLLDEYQVATIPHVAVLRPDASVQMRSSDFAKIRREVEETLAAAAGGRAS